MIYLITKGYTRLIDSMEIKIDTKEEKVYSILSLSYAYLSDVDINSEFLRFIGDFRF